MERQETTMRKRILPTGVCWCGCGADVPVGSFFVPGHDKRAEADLIKEVFGGVPQFLSAFGRVPGREPIDPEHSWTRWANMLAGLEPGNGGAHFIVEYINPKDRTGALLTLGYERHRASITLKERIDFESCTATFLLNGQNILIVPLFDLDGVCFDEIRKAHVVRVHGTFVPAQRSSSGLEYVGFARS